MKFLIGSILLLINLRVLANDLANEVIDLNHQVSSKILNVADDLPVEALRKIKQHLLEIKKLAKVQLPPPLKKCSFKSSGGTYFIVLDGNWQAQSSLESAMKKVSTLVSTGVCEFSEVKASLAMSGGSWYFVVDGNWNSVGSFDQLIEQLKSLDFSNLKITGQKSTSLKVSGAAPYIVIDGQWFNAGDLKSTVEKFVVLSESGLIAPKPNSCAVKQSGGSYYFVLAGSWIAVSSLEEGALKLKKLRLAGACK